MGRFAASLLLALAAQGAAGELSAVVPGVPDGGTAAIDPRLTAADFQFPDSWGKPPENDTDVWKHLPGGYGYGYGSSTDASWISSHIKEDVAAGKIHFPPAFGDPPRGQSRDLVKLPFGYGYGSGSIAKWLTQRAREVYDEPEGGKDLPLGRRPFARLAELKYPRAAAPAHKFPTSWGPPPRVQSKDYVPLAGGYGHGSGTISKWILSHLERDRKAGEQQFPPAFGEPPMRMTADYGPLPFGYGHGSGTLAKWLQSKAKEVYGAEAAEYKGFHGNLRGSSAEEKPRAALAERIFSM